MKTYTRNCGGSAYLTVLIVIFVMASYLAVIESASVQRGYMSQKLGDRMRAQCIAESGANAAYAVIKNNFYAWSNATYFPITTNYAGGTYTVGVSLASTSGATVTEVTIYSTGKVSYVHGGVTNWVTQSDVAMSVMNTPTGTGGSGPSGGGAGGAYSNAILTGGNMNFSGTGNFNVSNGVFHSNGSITHTGTGNIVCKTLECCGSSTFSGTADVTATNVYIGGNMAVSGTGNWNVNGLYCDALNMSGTGWIQKPGNVWCSGYTNSGTGGEKGTLVTGTNCTVAPVTIPVIDLTPYAVVASNNGEYFNGNQTLSGTSAITPPGGVMYVNGTLTISGTGQMTGSFIATGDITISGTGNMTETNGYPQVASLNGNISITGTGNTGSATAGGLIYAHTGTFSRSGTGNMIGQIISAGDMTAAGTWNGLVYGSSVPVTPGSSGSSGSGTVVGLAGFLK